MGVYGYSYSAMLGAYAISKTTLFRAAVFEGGRYDRRAFAGGGGPYGQFETDFAKVMGGTSWEIPHVYDELSPTSHVANVKTPVLILYGENDSFQQAAPSLYTAYLRETEWRLNLSFTKVKDMITAKNLIVRIGWSRGCVGSASILSNQIDVFSS